MRRPASRSLVQVSMLDVMYAGGDDNEADGFRNR